MEFSKWPFYWVTVHNDEKDTNMILHGLFI